MNWDTLISARRFGMEQYHDPRRHTRTVFRRDYDRMVFSSPFRRLQNKTQVFPLPGSVFVHNRLTHSLEVSSVGRSMANEVTELLRPRYSSAETLSKLDDIGDIVATACLCHDLGNPPFGHSGEKTISTFFSEGGGLKYKDRFSAAEWTDLTRFEGNANSFRLLTHQFRGRRHGGYAMTYSVLASIVKYPYSSEYAGADGKFGFFTSEAESFRKIADELGIPCFPDGKYGRHPLVYLVEAADDICYQIMDIEDAHRLHILSTETVKHLFMAFFGKSEAGHMEEICNMLEDPNEQVAYLRSHVIGALVGACARAFVDAEPELLTGEKLPPLVEQIDAKMADAYRNCSRTAWSKIYCAPDVVDVELAGNRIVTYLMERLTEAVMHPEKNASQLLLHIIPLQYDTSSPTAFGRIQSVLDHVSAMTDVYALNLYRKLNGHSLPAV